MKTNYLKYFLAITILINLKSFAQVPYEWPIVNAQVIPTIDTANSKALSLWNGKPYCTSFAGDLLNANSNQGYSLFTPTPPGPPVPAYENRLLGKVDTMLIMMDTIGYKSVDITISYPLLVDSFPNEKTYLDFYKRVYAMARSLGFKIIENCQVSLAADTSASETYMVRDIDSFYFHPHGVPDTLNTARYLTTMTQMMQTIIDSLTPDYLTLEMEPQTQQFNLYNLLSFAPDSTLKYVNYFLSHLTHKGNILYGAGAGTWDLLSYFQKYATTTVDYLDYHVYPINGHYLNNMVFQVDSIAQANGKKIVVGECWLHKNSDSEYVHENSSYIEELDNERNVFNYFEGPDTLFTQMMINLSQQANIELVNFFNTPQEFGYITWKNAYNSLSISTITNLGSDSENTNMLHEKLGPLGVFTKKAIGKINCNPLGVNNIPQANNEINIYPNPSTNQLFISFSGQVQSIEIDNILGQCITKVKTGSTQTLVLMDINNLAPGIYFARLLSSNVYWVKKFVKE